MRDIVKNIYIYLCIVPRLPLQTQTPIIMVGPGTGIAPFRGFLQERAHARANGREVGDNILYFGCRHRDQDFLYQEARVTFLF